MVHPLAFDFVAQWLRELMDEGCHTEACIIAKRLLLCEEEGITREFRSVAAELLGPAKKKGRGRPGAKAPQFWRPLGMANEKLRESGFGPEEMRFERLGKEFAMSPRSVERAVTYYRQHRPKPLLAGNKEAIKEAAKLIEHAVPGMADWCRALTRQ